MAEERWGEPGADVSRWMLRSADDVARIEATPPLSHVPGATIHAALRHAAAANPGRAAIIQLADPGDTAPVSIDFQTYLRRVEQAANLFDHAAAGTRPVVAIVAPYMPEAFIAAWGAAVGGIYVPINPYLEFAHVAGIMNACGANILVIATDAVGPGAWTRLADLQRAVPGLRATFRIGCAPDGDDFETAASVFPAGALTFDAARSPDEVCAYLHTGGTTATPKLVKHTHGGQLLQGWLCGTAMGSEDDAVIGHAMPNFHVGGAIAVGMRGIVFAQTVVTLTTSGFRNPGIVPAFWDIAERFGMTTITTAPTTAAAILDADGDGPRTLRQFTTGGGPLAPALARRWRARYGLHAREVWGGTEFHGILSFHYGGDVPPRLGSCGRTVPYHEVMSAILDGNRFVRPAGRDERGILIARGPSTISGYLDPANDEAFFVDGGPGGHLWASTGDVGTVDEDGFIWIFGREKDVIIRGGHNIDSAAIDEVIASHPAVLHVAAVGKPCPVKGELPMVYVQLRPGASADQDAILAHARANMQERAAVPVEVVFIDAMPMTAVGKVSKPPLRIDAVQRVAEQVAGVAAPGCALRVAELGGRAVVSLSPQDEGQVAALEEAFEGFTFAIDVQASARIPA